MKPLASTQKTSFGQSNTRVPIGAMMVRTECGEGKKNQ